MTLGEPIARHTVVAMVLELADIAMTLGGPGESSLAGDGLSFVAALAFALSVGDGLAGRHLYGAGHQHAGRCRRPSGSPRRSRPWPRVADDASMSIIELAIAFVIRHPGVTSRDRIRTTRSNNSSRRFRRPTSRSTTPCSTASTRSKPSVDLNPQTPATATRFCGPPPTPLVSKTPIDTAAAPSSRRWARSEFRRGQDLRVDR